MKYYLYCSSTKIDMIYSQIPTKLLKKVSAELKLDLKLASITVKNTDTIDTEYSKIKIIHRALTKAGLIGTVQFPQAYVASDELAKWVLVAGGTVVWLIKRGTTLLVMTGSAEFLVGGRRPDQELGLHSYAWSALVEMAANSEDLSMNYPDSTSRMLAGVAHADRLLTPIHQQINFLAIVQQVINRKELSNSLSIYWESFPGIDRIILGSPLFVSLSDNVTI